MINQRKVRTMAKAHVFENGEGREALKLKDHCEEMPLWKNLGFSALCGVLLFILFGILGVIAFPELPQNLMEHLGNVLAVVVTILALAAFAVLYSLVSDLIFRYLYRKKRSSLCGYTAAIQRLDKIRREQEQ